MMMKKKKKKKKEKTMMMRMTMTMTVPRGMPRWRCTSPKLLKMSSIACESFWCVLGVSGGTDDEEDDDDDDDDDDDESVTHIRSAQLFTSYTNMGTRRIFFRGVGKFRDALFPSEKLTTSF